MWQYIKILDLETMSAAARAEAISKELYYITRPPHVRQQDDLSIMVFSVVEAKESVYLEVLLDYIISVHPENDVSTLAALFPDLSAAEKNSLVQFIQNSNSFEFQNIIPQGTPILSEIP